MPFYTYILTNLPRRTVLYTGHTDDLARRITQHTDNADTPDFSARYNCHHLVWYEVHDTREDAKAREASIKRWRREWKDALVEKDNPDWKDLSDGDWIL